MVLVSAVVIGAVSRVSGSVPPLTPDGDEARRWAERELADPVYAAAQPTAFDRIAQAVADFFTSLFGTQLGDGWGPWAAVVAAVIVVVLIVVAILVWGLPRATGRARPVGELFGEAEERSAAALRSDAASLAGKGEWDAAIVVRFRALARGLFERGAVDTPPGATVHAFARAAARAFPASGDELEASAAAFDDVRYLRRPGTEALYRRIVAVDETVTAARPILSELSELSAARL